jgi:hypothetical protein
MRVFMDVGYTKKLDKRCLGLSAKISAKAPIK